MAELAMLRGKRRSRDLESWVVQFGKGDVDRAARYLEAVKEYFGGAGAKVPPGEWRSYEGGKSPKTKKVYLYAVTDFFEWAAQRKGKVVSPEDVSRADVAEYVQYLSNPRPNLDEEKVKDGDREQDREIVEIVRDEEAVTLADFLPIWWEKKHYDMRLLDKLMETDPLLVSDYGVSNRAPYRHMLGRLVKEGLLSCTPTVSELRNEQVLVDGVWKRPYAMLGIQEWEKGGIPFDFLFTYSLVPERKSARSTVALRVTALSSFWESLMRGENRAGGEPLLKYNVWTDAQKALLSNLRAEKKASAARSLLSVDEVASMLSVQAKGNTVGLRDRAMLYLLAFSGIRVNELVTLKRGVPTHPERMAGWFEPGELPRIFVTRKRGKREYIPYPAVALQALQDFQAEIDKFATPAIGKQSKDKRAPAYLAPDNPAWFFLALKLPSAPLFPSIANWGNNASVEHQVRHLSAQAVDASLKRIARRARFSDEQVDRVHAHAFRHFFATAARAGGMPIHEIQARLGISSLTTLETYFDAPPEAKTSTADQAILQGMGVVAPTPAPAPKPAHPARRDAEVIETKGEESPLEQAPAPVLGSLETGFMFASGTSETVGPNRLPAPPPVSEVVVFQDRAIETEKLSKEAERREQEGVSLGSPDYAYLGLERHGRGEPIAFARRKPEGEGFNINLPPDKPAYQAQPFLAEYYDPWPSSYGLGQRSLLPYFFSGGGVPDKWGFFAGIPPLPVWSRSQTSVDTERGEKMLSQIEAMYLRFLTGDEERAPNPVQAYGLLRWYGFFVYASARLSTYFVRQYRRPSTETKGKTIDSTIVWQPWESDITLSKSFRNVREHDETWLLSWLERNSHTYTTSLREFRNVARTDSADQWLLASLEGVKLADTKLPEWFAADDPLALPEQEWPSFVAWLSNVTGKRYTTTRKEEREQASVLDVAAVQEKRAKAEQILTFFFESNDQFFEARKTRDYGQQDMSVENVKAALASYVGMVRGFGELSDKERAIFFDDRKMDAFMRAFGELAMRLEVPNPFDESWQEQHARIAPRIAAMVNALYPQVSEEDVLLEGNIVADSELFSQLVFDPNTRTVTVSPDYRATFIEKYGQAPELLLRRALRGMWEAWKDGNETKVGTREREKLYNVMLSYLAWIVPSGREMEERMLQTDVARILHRRAVKGFKYEELTAEEHTMLRLEWLRQYHESIERLASGDFYWLEKQADDGVTDDQARGYTEIDDTALDEEALEEAARPERAAPPMKRRRVVANPPSRLTDLGVALVAYDVMLVASSEGTTEAAMPAQGRRQGRALRKNGPEGLFVYQPGEKTSRWNKALTPNGRKVFYSAEAVKRTLDAIYAPTMLLPSPFRQILTTVLR